MMTVRQCTAGTADWLADFHVDSPVAHGLPATAYLDEGFWRRECDRVFARHWVFAGFAHQMTAIGDVCPTDVAGQPILLVRGRDSQIRAFHNVCRHRCLKLVDEPCNAGAVITCPYHAWAYGLDGSLRSTPYFGGKDHRPEGFEPADYGLLPVRSVTWHDWVFVDLSGEAPAFEDYVAPLAGRLTGLDLDLLTPVALLDFGPIETNWKFLMENFMEPYHVQFVHKSTTEQPLADHYTVVDGPCLGSAVDVAEEKDASGGTLAVSSRYLTLFPSFVLGRYFPDQLGVYLNQPLGPGKTRQKRAIYATEGVAFNAKQVEELKVLWTSVHREDHTICERLQAGRASAASADGGLLSPYWEDSVRRFQELVVAAVCEEEQQP